MKPYIKFGLLAGLFSIIWTLVMYVFELDKSSFSKALGWISIIASLAFIVLAVKESKSVAGGYINFGDAFKDGFLVMLISGIIGVGYFYLHVSFVDDGFVEHIVENTRLEMSKQQDLTEEQMEQAWKYTEMFLTPGVMAFFGLLAHLVTGTIGALIIAAIMRKEPPVFNEVTD
ncbi:MAG: DUF4199 domain-containing protein [Bacteroidia bacterium]|nr:DUF4199 domain-containing protein [Bacteroidia bacterium]HQV00309.1 DUF4199 domain-containing protein [Bacteroidia bacterium]